jgi:hypothetical protein
MDISNIRTRVDALNKRSDLVARKPKPDDAPVLTLVDTVEQSDTNRVAMSDPLIQALIEKLPQPNSVWSLGDRANWLKTAAMAFNLVYRTAEAESAGSKTDEKAVVQRSA